jgi:hypothetical protein
MPRAIISDPKQLQEHVYAFYRELLGTTAQRFCSLAPAIWGEAECISEGDNAAILLTYTEEELEEIVNEMKTETAPGPDGFPR